MWNKSLADEPPSLFSLSFLAFSPKVIPLLSLLTGWRHGGSPRPFIPGDGLTWPDPKLLPRGEDICYQHSYNYTRTVLGLAPGGRLLVHGVACLGHGRLYTIARHDKL